MRQLEGPSEEAYRIRGATLLAGPEPPSESSSRAIEIGGVHQSIPSDGSAGLKNEFTVVVYCHAVPVVQDKANSDSLRHSSESSVSRLQLEAF
jgi:hypothetical protein